AIIAFLDRLLSKMALSDIPEDDDHSLDVAVRVPDWSGFMLDGSSRPVRGDEHYLVVREENLTAADHLGNRQIIGHLGSFLDRPKDLVQRATNRLIQTPSGETTGDRIQENHLSVGIGRDHGISNAR